MCARFGLLALLVAGCGASDNPRGERPGAGGQEPTDPGSTPKPPGPFTASCELTTNALRVRCTVEVDPPQPVRVRFAPAGGGDERVRGSELTAGEHEIPLYLLAPSTDYVFTAETVDGEVSVSGTFSTGEPPPAIARGAMTVSGTSSVPYVGTHLPCESHAIAVIYDTTTGEVAWFGMLDENGSLGWMDMVRYTDDGTILGETGHKVVEMDLTGRKLLELTSGVDYEAALHHDLYKRDGYIYALLQDTDEQPVLDGFVVFGPDGEQVAEWRARDHLAIPPEAEGDWMHTNSIFVDAAGDVYLSTLTQNTILKVNGDWTSDAFGALEWALAGSGPAGFGQDFVVDWSEVGVDRFGDQHDLKVLDDGRISLLDNLNGRGLLIALDEDEGTAVVEGEYATRTSCGPQGTTATTGAGNVLVGCSDGDLREYTPSGEKVWEAVIDCEGAPALAARFYPIEGDE